MIRYRTTLAVLNIFCFEDPQERSHNDGRGETGRMGPNITQFGARGSYKYYTDDVRQE